MRIRGRAGGGEWDAVVVGAGPNGLAAAIALLQAGRSVRVLEASPTVGGGARTEPLTLPGHRHDTCSAIHPLAIASPFLRRLPLERHGLRFLHPDIPLAHPLDGGRAAVLHRSVDQTVAGLGRDGRAYGRLIAPLAARWEGLTDDLLGLPWPLPRHPLAAARFGIHGVRSARGLAEARFAGEHARALFAGSAAHSMLALTRPPSAGFGLLLQVLGHGPGWPAAAGGSQAITGAMASLVRELGGVIETERPVETTSGLSARAVLLDLTPRQILRVAGGELPRRYARALRRYRYGPGVFKLDYALSEPVPWAAPACRTAGTVHVGGTLPEVAAAEDAVARGRHAERPFVLVAQQSLFDPTRAPAGRHTLWAYCHVPNGSTVDMTAAIERQIERFAPGFREVVAARTSMNTRELEAHNRNFVGGDINGGSADLRQLWARPALRLAPWSTPNPRLFVCSAATPPGGGVHGMCGFHAARAALRGVLR
jgi:phytoene dehydrogenase-like protein